RVGANYFSTIGATLTAGREIDRTDTAKSRRVVVVNEAFMRQYHPGERAISVGGSPEIAIVGVVKDIAHEGVRSKPAPTVYLPWTQSPTNFAPTVVVRGAVTAATLRRELGLDGEPRPLRTSIDRSIFQDRLLATLGGFFGLLAL